MKSLLLRCLSGLFNLFDRIAPKCDYIVFSSRAAKDFADNSKYLFEEFQRRGHNNIFFYTKKKSVLRRIGPKGIYAYSLKGVLTLLRAKTLVITHGLGDFFPYQDLNTDGRTVMHLFHAVAVKKVGHGGDPQKVAETKKWDHFVVSSNFEKDFIQDQYTLPTEKIVIAGQPRNDVLFEKTERPEDWPRKMILYAPTFRDDTTTKLFPFGDKNLERLDEELSKKECQLMIRLHINEEQHYKSSPEFQGLKNIFFAGSDIHPSVNDILPHIDAVVTDYSSVAIDFLLLDRPVAYIPYDYDHYNEVRGFSFDFHEHLAGQCLASQADFVRFISEPIDQYRTKRAELRKLFHLYQDGKSSHRIYEFMCS